MTNMNPMFPWAEQLREAMLRVGVDIGGMPVNDAMQVVVGRIASLTEQLEAARRDAGEAEDCLEEKWQPIEAAPRDGTWVLGFFPELGVSQMKWFSYGTYAAHWMRFGSFTPVYNPTHWMPLPEPPREKE